MPATKELDNARDETARFRNKLIKLAASGDIPYEYAILALALLELEAESNQPNQPKPENTANTDNTDK